MTFTRMYGCTRRSRTRAFLLPIVLLLLAHSAGVPVALQAAPTATSRVYLPMVSKPVSCLPIPDESYAAITSEGGYNPKDPPPEQHPDLNLAVRGYWVTNAEKRLVDYGGPTDGGAPQLRGLFVDRRIPDFRTVYQVYSWDWGNQRPGPPEPNWPVTLAGLATAAGETIHVPESGYDIGLLANGYAVMVLYASPGQIIPSGLDGAAIIW